MTTLNGQVDLGSAIEGTALPGNTDVASFTDDNLSDGPSAFTATIDWGDGVTTTNATVIGSNGSFTVEGGHTYADDNFYSPIVTITRTADSSSLTLFGGVSVSDADTLSGHSAPTISGNSGVALTNVTVATFNTNTFGAGNAADFTVSIDWGDGQTTAGTLSLNGTVYTVTGSHTYATDGNFTITTFMNDDSPDTAFSSATTQADIGFGGTETFSSAVETIAVPAGTTVATFADNAGDPVTDYTAAIDWGDGTTTAGVVSGSGPTFTVTSAVAHTYTDEGLFTETVTITRAADGTVPSATIAPSGTVTVSDADSIGATAGPAFTADPGVPLTLTVATFTDSNHSNVAGDFVATIDWGDGTTSTGTVTGSSGSFTVTDTHTYQTNGEFTVTVGIGEDPADGQATANATVSIPANRIGLSPGSGSSISAIEGTPVPAGTQVATFDDADNTDTASAFTASIDWGDGTTPTTGTITGSNGSFTVTGGPHTYADEGSAEGGIDTITTTVTRTADSQTATVFGQAAIAEADHLVLTADNISGSQGTPINNAQVATFTDTFLANTASDFSAIIDWGDGSTTAGTVVGSSGSFTVDGSHTYTSPGTDQFIVKVFDDDFGSATGNGTGTATIAARTVTGTMVLASATEATALANTTTVATFTDTDTSDMAGDFTATINWGDGVTTTGTVVGSNGSFTVQGGHTYADEGSDPASVTLTHTADNAMATASGSVAVGEADVLTGHGTTIKPKSQQAFSGAVATFSDTDTANVAGDFTATINWGDGTTTAGTVSGGSGTFTVSGSHTYTHAGHENMTVTLTDDAPGTATATAHSTANVSTTPKNDFNGDFKSDLLLQGSTASHPDVMVELLNGKAIASSGTITTPKGWVVEAAADFNNDLKSDIVLQNTNGTPQIWLMNGTSRTSTVTLANPGSAWHVIAAADFNNDGSPDLLFQNTNGTPQIWLMNGTSVTSTATLTNPGSSWRVIGAGDFNNDGNADILFQNFNGTPMIWEMNGTSVIASATLPNPGGSWLAIGTGDFNGDGNSDILFENNNGTPMIWEMNGTSIVTQATLPNPGASWLAIGTSDFNGDGMADILWQRSDATPMVWEMNGTSIASSFTLPNPGNFLLKDDGPIPRNEMASNSQQPTLRTSSPDTGAGFSQSAPDTHIATAVAPQAMGRQPLFGVLPF